MANENLHAGHRERLRKKCLENPELLSDHEVLELILFYSVPRKNTNDIAHRLLARFGSIPGVLDASPEQLCMIPGLGETSVKMFPVLRELYRRCVKQRIVMRKDKTSVSEYIGDLFAVDFDGELREKVVVVGLNAQQKIITSAVIGSGDNESAEIDMPRLVEVAKFPKLRSVILMHNHPSGCGLPSMADYSATDKVCEVLSWYNISLLDHLIFDGEGDYLSFRQSRFFEGHIRPEFAVTIREACSLSDNYDPAEFVKTPLVADIVTKMKKNNPNA